MISFKTKWENLFGFSPKEMERLKGPTVKAVTKATLLFEGAVKKKLTGPRTGRIYGSESSGRDRKGRFSRTHRDARGRFRRAGHQASAPGEPPATLTGHLRQSITHEIRVSKNTVEGEVGTNDPKARILEYGGVTGAGHRTRILPRPYMEPTWIENADKINAILEESTQS